MIVRVERTGGFTGISQCSEMNSDDLPASLKSSLANLVEHESVSSYKFAPKGGADHYCYRITFDDGLHKRVIERSQYDLQNKLKSLVSYIEKHKK